MKRLLAIVSLAVLGWAVLGAPGFAQQDLAPWRRALERRKAKLLAQIQRHNANPPDRNNPAAVRKAKYVVVPGLNTNFWASSGTSLAATFATWAR